MNSAVVEMSACAGGRWILSVVRYNVEAWAKHPGQVELRVKTFARQRPVLNQYPQYSRSIFPVYMVLTLPIHMSVSYPRLMAVL